MFLFAWRWTQFLCISKHSSNLYFQFTLSFFFSVFYLMPYSFISVTFAQENITCLFSFFFFFYLSMFHLSSLIFTLVCHYSLPFSLCSFFNFLAHPFFCLLRQWNTHWSIIFLLTLLHKSSTNFKTGLFTFGVFKIFLRLIFRDIEACGHIMASLGTCMQHLKTLIGWCEPGELFPREPHSPEELFKQAENINMYCFYGRLLGFQVLPPHKRMFIKFFICER